MRLSRVSMTTRTPTSRKDRIASAVVGLIGSAIANTPEGFPSIATKIAVAPSPRKSSAVFSSDETSIARACIISRLPMSMRRPSLLHGGLEWRVGALRRYPSSDADEFGLPELAHSVERFDRDGNLGRTSGVVA